MEPDSLLPALKKAATEDVPVCILYMDASYNWSGQSKFLNMPGLESFIRVKQYEGRYVEEYSVLQNEIPYTIWVPSLWLTDGEGNLIGYVPNQGNSREWQNTLAQARDVMKWKRSARKSLDTAEKSIESGPFTTLLKTLDDVEAKDKRYTATIRASYRATSVDQLRQELSSPNLSSGQRERLERRVARATQMFFDERVKDLRKRALESIDKTYARSEEMLYGGSPKEAFDSLRPLAGCKINPMMDQKVATLREKILTAMRTGEIPKRDGATSTPDGDNPPDETKADSETKSEPETKAEPKAKEETTTEPESKADVEDDKEAESKDEASDEDEDTGTSSS
jgi:hypothetical protein